MKSTVEYAFEELNKWRIENLGEYALIGIPQEVFDKAKGMEFKERLKNQIFIGKVAEIIGFDKTLKLLIESKEAIK
jgi:hypothetical protein